MVNGTASSVHCPFYGDEFPNLVRLSKADVQMVLRAYRSHQCIITATPVLSSSFKARWPLGLCQWVLNILLAHSIHDTYAWVVHTAPSTTLSTCRKFQK